MELMDNEELIMVIIDHFFMFLISLYQILFR